MGHFISPGGPALLYVLKLDSMEVPDGGPPKALTIMHQIPEMDPSTIAKEHMDSYTDGCPSGVYMYSWGQITLCIAAVLADRNLPNELVALLQGLASSSPCVSSSVMANAGCVLCLLSAQPCCGCSAPCLTRQRC